MLSVMGFSFLYQVTSRLLCKFVKSELLRSVESRAWCVLWSMLSDVCTLWVSCHLTVLSLCHTAPHGRRQSDIRGACPPIVDWVDFHGKKLAKVTLFSLPEVFCGPQTCVGDPGYAPYPAGGAHDAPQTP